MGIYNFAGEEIKGMTEEKARDYYCCFSLFETIGVIGDSYAAGVSADQPDSSVDGAHAHYNACWPAVMARRNGVSVSNYSYGGLSTRSWITNKSYGLPKLLSDDPKQLYLLALERNDYNIQNRAAVGSADEHYLGDITDITLNSLGSYPSTFYGNYATIIETIQNFSPRSRLVMITGDYSDRNTTGKAFHDAMAAIAAHFGIPVMRQRDDDYFHDDYYCYDQNGGHPQPIAYTGLYLALERLFNRCVAENRDYFQYYTGVL